MRHKWRKEENCGKIWKKKRRGKRESKNGVQATMNQAWGRRRDEWEVVHLHEKMPEFTNSEGRACTNVKEFWIPLSSSSSCCTRKPASKFGMLLHSWIDNKSLCETNCLVQEQASPWLVLLFVRAYVDELPLEDWCSPSQEITLIFLRWLLIHLHELVMVLYCRIFGIRDES